MTEISFLPGPVAVTPRVKAALVAPAISHRSDAFNKIYGECEDRLLQLGKSRHVAMLMGSGTAANAVVAQELKKLPGRGLILANGEFGDRLISQGEKAGLDFDTHVLGWGQSFEFDNIQKLLDKASWLWLVHCETSTGAINLDARLAAYCRAHDIKLCLDSISALGNQEVDFSDIYLASGTSGKGLCSFAGIAMVFYNHGPQLADYCHDYLDLAVYHRAAKVPFTFSSNLLNALHTALLTTDYQKKFARNARHAVRMAELLAANKLHSPLRTGQADYIWTVALPHKVSSSALGSALGKSGVFVHYKNRYLLANNWMQIAFMGSTGAKQTAAGLNILACKLNQIQNKWSRP